MAEDQPQLTTWDVTNIARLTHHLPDGTKLTGALKAVLVVLATHYPNIWPNQFTLADELSIDRSVLNKRLRVLEDVGFVRRFRRGRASTVYQLDLKLLLQCRNEPTGIYNNSEASEGSASADDLEI